MSAGGERKPDDPEHQTPPNPKSGSSPESQANEEPSHRSPGAARETDASSGDTEGLPPGQPLPPGAEMLRRASGSSIDSFSDEAADLSLLTAEHFQRRYAHFEVEMGSDGKPVELGRGAMGITYKASDTTLRRAVALKVISSRLLHNESLKNRFLREARAAASLRHPYVASIYYLGSTEASYFYAMELIEGQTLEAFITQHGPLDVKLALEITAQIASALAAAYQAGLVHRDIKPANIILTREGHGQLTAKVIDFGLVKFAAGDIEESTASEPGIFLGTPRYASPEQISCGPIDIRSDLYSVGVTLWQMLTKSAPFMGTPSEVAAQHLQAPLPISKLKYFPQPVVALLTHLLEKDPKDRPQTPEDLLAIVRATQRNLAGHRVAPTIAPVSATQRKRFLPGKSYIIGGGAALVLAGLLGAYFFFRPGVPAAGSGEKSVAVLPFDNVGGDKQNDYLSDGLTTEVIFQLSKIADLRVISRDSVLGYKATPGAPRKSLNEIGRELNVETVLESSVQRLDQQIKIIAVLYDARTGKRLWGAAYNREMRDLFAIQTDVAENLASALQVRLSPNERDEIQQKPTDNVTAYDLFLQGRAYYLLRHKDDNEKAIELFRQALELDPKFSLGYVGLASAYIDRNVRFGEDAFWVDSAIDLCKRAVSIDPTQARAYVVLARAYRCKNLFDQAAETITKALRLAPNDAEVNFRAGSQRLGSSADSEAYSMLRKAYSLDPNDPRKSYLLGLICAVIGEDELREKWMQRTIQLESDPDRKKMLECELLTQRREYLKAFNELKDLPPDAVAYGPTALDLRVACAERASDWSFAIRATEAKADTDAWAQFHLALAYHFSGDATRASAEATKLQTSAKSLLTIHSTDRDGMYYLAVSDRILGLRDEANELLRKLFPESISVLPQSLTLLRDDPSLDVFKQDSSYQELVASYDKKDAETRARIVEIEKSSPQ
jgi:TolB-like protein